MNDHKKRRILFYHFIWISKYNNNNVHAGPFYQTTVWLTQFKIHTQQKKIIRRGGEEEHKSHGVDECICFSNLWPSVTVSCTSYAKDTTTIFPCSVLYMKYAVITRIHTHIIDKSTTQPNLMPCRNIISFFWWTYIQLQKSWEINASKIVYIIVLQTLACGIN